jgi:RimJ/RimL family protein N-acetyltransferase
VDAAADAPALNVPFSHQETLTTDRLLLRPFRFADRDCLARLQRSPGLARYLLWEPPDDEELDRRLEEKVHATLLVIKGDRLCVAIERIGQPGLIGEASLVIESVDDACLEVGYIVHPDVAGQGIAREAVRALVDLAFTMLHAHRVIGRIDARNKASAKVLTALGMRQESHCHSDQFVKGEWTDEVLFAQLRSEWTAQR